MANRVVGYRPPEHIDNKLLSLAEPLGVTKSTVMGEIVNKIAPNTTVVKLRRAVTNDDMLKMFACDASIYHVGTYVYAMCYTKEQAAIINGINKKGKTK